MISLLCPTRGRPRACRASVRTLLARADHPERVEVLLRRDDDDTADYDEVADVARAGGIGRFFIWIGPRLDGYASLDDMVNQLAAMAEGDWLMVWNDDAEMASEGWDSIIEALPPTEITVQDLMPDAEDHLNLFPVVSRAMYDLVGHMARDPHTDTYLQTVARRASVEVPVRGVTIHHHREMGPQEHEQGTRGDATYEDRLVAIQQTSPHFFRSEEVQASIAADVARIMQAIGGEQ